MATRHCAEGGCGAEVPVDSTDALCFTCRIKAAMDTGNAPVSVAPGTAGPSVPDAFPAAPGTRIGDYEIVDVIASGGMGVIFRARQVSLNRTVALKMVLGGRLASLEDVRRFRIEAEAVAAMDHPNIVPIYEVGQERGSHYFSMKLVEGSTLTDKVPEFVRDPRRSARLMALVARAVHYAHQRGILHRDLKPANVLLGPEDIPYLTDFGIARRIEGAKTLTQDGMVIGTPEYMAPEQASGDGKSLTTAIDVYGLGAILYELLTGRPPFKGASPLETLRHLTEKEPARPRSLAPGLDIDLETVCLRCLEKDPHRRYGSAERVAEELESWRAGEPIRARRTTAFERAVKWARRRPVQAALVGVSALSLLILAGGGAWFTRRLDRELTRTEAARQELQLALTRQVAERLDSDLRQLSTIPQAMAALLSRRSDWSEGQLGDSLREMLQVDGRLFGICAAFEPFQFDPGRKDFALYHYRSPGGTATKLLSPETYQPLYREWAWYGSPQSQGKPVWIQPYFDKGGGEIWMATYSVPFRRADRFAGVVTADLSIDAYVKVLRGWLDELSLGQDAYGFVLDETGTIVSHPNPRYFRKKLAELCPGAPGRPKDPLMALDSSSGRMSSFTFSRVASAGWHFVAVVPDASPDEPRRGRLAGGDR